MSKKFQFAMITMFCFLVIPAMLAAEQSLSANDLSAAQLTAPTVFDGFTVLATADKGVTIEAMSEVRTADDGEIFNNRIKLNGGGSATFRAIKFTVKDNAQLSVYLNSSSGTDARVLKVTDGAGTVLAELAAPADDKVKAGLVTFKLAKGGDYLVFSAASGINIYQIVIK